MQELGDNTIQRVDWQNVFPVVLLPRAYKFALGGRVIFLALLGLVLTTIVASYLAPEDYLRSKQPPYFQQAGYIPPTGSIQTPFLFLQGSVGWILQNYDLMTESGTPKIWQENGLYVPGQKPARDSRPFLGRPIAHPWTQLTGSGYSVFSSKTFVGLSWFVIALIIWASCGGLITRIVALRFVQDRRESFSQLFGFMRKKWLSYVGAMILPMIGIFLALLPIWLIGWIWQFLPTAWGFDLAHLILAFPFALVTVLMAIGLMFGWPLMFAAVSAEGSDAFDAISRGFSYVYQRPMQFVFYHLCNQVIYAIGIIIAYFVFYQTVSLIDSNPAGLMILFNSFAFAYFWSSQTVIYFLLRRSCDATPYDQVYLGDIKKRTLPPFGVGKNGEPEV